MEHNSNPYRTPEALVEPHPAATPPHNVRTLVRALVILQFALIPLVMLLPDSLPPELRPIRDAREAEFFNAHGTLLLVIIVLHLVSLFGLWWEAWWAAWLFLVSNAVSYAIMLVGGPQISSDLLYSIDSLEDVVIGATLSALYVGGYFARAARERAS